MKFFGGKKEEPEETPKVGFFDRMKQAVSRTRESLSSKIEGLVALTRTVDESSLEDLESALLTSDLGVQTTNRILEALRDRARRQAIEGGDELRGGERAASEREEIRFRTIHGRSEQIPPQVGQPARRAVEVGRFLVRATRRWPRQRIPVDLARRTGGQLVDLDQAGHQCGW